MKELFASASKCFANFGNRIAETRCTLSSNSERHQPTSSLGSGANSMVVKPHIDAITVL